MKHSFLKNQKPVLLVLGMTLCTLSSCNHRKVSGGETATTAHSTAVEDTTCADNSPLDSDTATSPSTSESSSTETSESVDGTAYHAGYEAGACFSSWGIKLDE